MNIVFIIISFLIGFALGCGVLYFVMRFRTKTAREVAEVLLKESDSQRQAQIDAIIGQIRSIFGSLSLDALSKSSKELLNLARTSFDSAKEVNAKELETKKNLIDQQLQRMGSELEKVTNLMKELEKDRVERFGELTSQLKTTSEQTKVLTQITHTLKEALASSKVRGQWGERMAEDVLRIAGLIENVNYIKQKSIEGAGSRPDFTFLLPGNLRLNMDVKFPWDNYVKYLEADLETDREKFKTIFLKDVKIKIKEVTSRDYINPEQSTIDTVILFIPNEQLYGFIYEQDNSIIDEGLKNKVVICSPLTLFAVLAIIRQAVDNFALGQTSNEILSLMGQFKVQWDKFIQKLELFGKKISDAQREYEGLISIRRRQLERPLNKIEDLRTQRGLEPADEEGGGYLTSPEPLNDDTRDEM